MRMEGYFKFWIKSSMSSAQVTNNNRNVINLMQNGWSLGIGWESEDSFNFKTIPPGLQQWLTIITEKFKRQCRMFNPQVFDENRWIF